MGVRYCEPLRATIIQNFISWVGIRDSSVRHAIKFVVVARGHLPFFFVFSVNVHVILVQVFTYRPWCLVATCAIYRFAVVVCTRKAPLRKWNLVICLLHFWRLCHVWNVVNIIFPITAGLVRRRAIFFVMDGFKAGFRTTTGELLFDGVRGIVIVLLSRVMRPADRVVVLIVDFFVLWRGFGYRAVQHQVPRTLVLAPLERVEGSNDVCHVVKRHGVFLVWQLLPPSSDYYKGTHEPSNESQE